MEKCSFMSGYVILVVSLLYNIYIRGESTQVGAFSLYNYILHEGYILQVKFLYILFHLVLD